VNIPQAIIVGSLIIAASILGAGSLLLTSYPAERQSYGGSIRLRAPLSCAITKPMSAIPRLAIPAAAKFSIIIRTFV
jgi:hypothetical protein